MTRAIVTGARGFVGTYLVDLLLREGMTVMGVDRADAGPREEPSGQVEFRALDLEQGAELLGEVLAGAPVDFVFHLAAVSHIPTAWQDPGRVYRANVLGTLNVLEAVRTRSPSTRVLFVGSGTEYGVVPRDQQPIRETWPLSPIDPYATSKMIGEQLCSAYVRMHGLQVVMARAFNHTGPRQSPQFVCSALAKQIAELGRVPSSTEVSVGDLEAIRDFTDVRDVVSAYLLLARAGDAGEVYNVCSGKGWHIRDILQVLRHLAGREDLKAIARKETDRGEPLPSLVGDNAKIRLALGWTPRITLEQSLADLLDYWRASS